jgi:hypothetical protein
LSLGKTEAGQTPHGIHVEEREASSEVVCRKEAQQDDARPSIRSAEFQAAWHLEVWKRAEQVKWKAEMERERRERLELLEAEWIRKEAAWAAEIERWTKTQQSLQQRARQVVFGEWVLHLCTANGREMPGR